jgi:hypothetical protein
MDKPINFVLVENWPKLFSALLTFGDDALVAHRAQFFSADLFQLNAHKIATF